VGRVDVVKQKSEWLYYTLVYGFVIGAGLLCAFPMMHVVSASITPYSEVVKRGATLLFPRRVTLAAYAMFLEEPNVWSAFGNTVFITVVGTLVNIVFTVMTAYSLAKNDLIFRRFLTFLVLIPLIISASIIPRYLVVKSVGLIDSLWALILPVAISPYTLLITRTFFSRMDTSLYESARIDGASEWFILFRIVLPLSTPIMATIALIYGVNHWNTYMTGIIYLVSDNKRILQVVVRNLLSRSLNVDMIEYGVPTKTLQMAAVVFTSLPVILVYPFLQRYFTQGIMLGAIKG
jgi:putative aldouronate transport system permease protein